MLHLVKSRASSHLCKRGDHLLRQGVSVIVVPLATDERAYYSCFGMAWNGYPAHGVISSSAISAGKTMRKMYYNSTTVTRPGSYIWRQVTSAHDPEFVFYQGTYPCSQTLQGPQGYNEAYLQLAAYHFTIPAEYRGRNIIGASISVLHGGTIITHESAYDHPCDLAYKRSFAADAPVPLLSANSGFRGPWNMHIGVFPTLNDEPSSWVRSFQQTADFNTHLTQGSPSRQDDARYCSNRQLWYTNGVDYILGKGYIPVTTSPWNQKISLNSSALASIVSNGGGWVVIAPNVGYSNNDDEDTSSDYPIFYYNGSDYQNYWLCTSMWGYGLEIAVEDS